ncbi:phosphomannomutase/phosphoglucomutase [Streptomyces microflavus]|uniref:Phosphomannomutase/phosphoglucomutase n=1 Tax=Streptomyces microflavus TaxID=1919 RepID=A0A7H8MP10_STRMI|nr:phosphomannomutase/phosphoglucomutase [Streptomyces microflavus]QKW43913.1 phosphomannomutase/phosphoglucomutase [Streptomyces microflavus]
MSENYNSASYFEEILLSETGFREYDARWVIEPTDGISSVGLNYVGVRLLGLHLGRFLSDELDAGKRIVVGHDFRSYSENVKNALVVGLLQSGMNVTDIGLTTTPGAYYAQFSLDVACVAMVTASHNENGWTGIKMGHRKASTFGPVEMLKFKEYTLGGQADGSTSRSGSYTFKTGARRQYIDDLVDEWAVRLQGLPRLKVAVEAGNGTAGLYAPELLGRLGFDVVPGNNTPDWTFPHFNPNPESLPFLRSVETLVTNNGADLGLCFDGDGDRLGVIDDQGKLVFADRVGIVVAKFLEETVGATGPFVVDVKSTSLYESELTSDIVWAKTGHSYVKAKVKESGAVAGFERSGHFFFSEPIGRGYDDGCVAALALLWTLCSAKAAGGNWRLSDKLAELPKSFSSPNRQPYVSDETKYVVVEKLAAYFEQREYVAGKRVISVDRLNGVRLELEDRSWLLIRASSNSPNLVIIAETFDEDGTLLKHIDVEIRAAIEATNVEVGPFASLMES